MTINDKTNNKINALLEWHNDNEDTNVTATDVEQCGYDDCTFIIEGAEYRVFTDDEADAAVADYIADSAWAFNPDFLAGQTGLPAEVFKALHEGCEGSSEAVCKVIEGTCGMAAFVDNAVDADGRGHFLSQYDGEERELTGDTGTSVKFYAYRC